MDSPRLRMAAEVRRSRDRVSIESPRRQGKPSSNNGESPKDYVDEMELAQYFLGDAEDGWALKWEDTDSPPEAPMRERLTVTGPVQQLDVGPQQAQPTSGDSTARVADRSGSAHSSKPAAQEEATAAGALASDGAAGGEEDGESQLVGFIPRVYHPVFCPFTEEQQRLRFLATKRAERRSQEAAAVSEATATNNTAGSDRQQPLPSGPLPGGAWSIKPVQNIPVSVPMTHVGPTTLPARLPSHPLWTHQHDNPVQSLVRLL